MTRLEASSRPACVISAGDMTMAFFSSAMVVRNDAPEPSEKIESMHCVSVLVYGILYVMYGMLYVTTS